MVRISGPVLAVLCITFGVALNERPDRVKTKFLCDNTDICHANGVEHWQHCDPKRKRCRNCDLDEDKCFTPQMPGNCTTFCQEQLLKEEKNKGCLPLNQTNHGHHNGTIQGRHNHGALIELECDKGYRCDGSCLITCDDYGHYSGSLQCTEIHCDAFPLSRGVKLFPKKKEYRVDEKTNFTCDSGLKLVGPGHAICTADGFWNIDKTPTCVKDENTEESAMTNAIIAGVVCLAFGIFIGIFIGYCCNGRINQICSRREPSKRTRESSITLPKDSDTEHDPLLEEKSTCNEHEKVSIEDETKADPFDNDPSEKEADPKQRRQDEDPAGPKPQRSMTNADLIDMEIDGRVRFERQDSKSYPDMNADPTDPGNSFTAKHTESKDSGFKGSDKIEKGSSQTQEINLKNLNINITNQNNNNNNLNASPPKVEQKTTQTTQTNQKSNFIRPEEFCGFPTQEAAESKDCRAETHDTRGKDDGIEGDLGLGLEETGIKSMADHSEELIDQSLGEKPFVAAVEEQGKPELESQYHGQVRADKNPGQDFVTTGERDIDPEDLKKGQRS